MKKDRKMIICKDFFVGDRVGLINEPNTIGAIISIDQDCYPLEMYGITTCEIHWDDADDGINDVQWTNKIFLV